MEQIKIRGLRRRWQSMIRKFKLKLADASLDEVFFEESFSTEAGRIKGPYKRQIFKLLVDSFQWRVNALNEPWSLLWLQLDDILESSILIFKNEQEFIDFFRAKLGNDPNSDQLVLQMIKLEDLPREYAFYFDTFEISEGYLFRGIDIDRDEDYVYYFYLIANSKELNDKMIEMFSN